MSKNSLDVMEYATFAHPEKQPSLKLIMERGWLVGLRRPAARKGTKKGGSLSLTLTYTPGRQPCAICIQISVKVAASCACVRTVFMQAKREA